MSDNKAVMQMALEALGLYLMAGHGNSTDFTKQGVAYDKAIEGIAALSDAIAQPEQTATAAQAEITKSDLVYVYWSGYTSGHHDTVEGHYTDVNHHDSRSYHADVVDELISEGSIAQPEQTAKPVAWMTVGYMGEPVIQRHPPQYANQVTPLYDHPAPVRQPLTIQEVEHILAQHNYELHGDRARYIVRMTEAAHGIAQPKAKP